MTILQTTGSRPEATQRRSSRWPAAALALGLLLGSVPAAAESRLEGVADQAFLGLAATTCTVVYAPVKVFIAGSGFLVGSTAWIVTAGRREPAFSIWERTVGGDWVITPEHLSGDRDFTVLGRTSQTSARRHAQL